MMAELCSFQGVRTTAWQLLLALLLLFSTLAHAENLPSAPLCVVPTYLVKDECHKPGVSQKCLIWENRYILNVILAKLLPKCGCYVRLLDRNGSVAAIRSLATLDAPAMFLVARWGLSRSEQVAVQDMANEARKKLVVLHLGDEKALRPHTMTWYPLVKAVFRNYHHDQLSLHSWISYLKPTVTNNPTSNNQQDQQQQQQQQQHKSVFWVPLGPGESFMPTAVAALPWRARPLLWSWGGSTHEKWERLEMLKWLKSSTVMDQGVLKEMDLYRAVDMWSPLRYTDLLLQSQLVPIPKGVHCEQFRVWEAFSAGAIPLAAQAHQDDGLAHLHVLGFKILWVNSWQEVPQVMMSVLSNATMQEELGRWQQHNWMLYKDVMGRVGQKVAEAVCGEQHDHGQQEV